MKWIHKTLATVLLGTLMLSLSTTALSAAAQTKTQAPAKAASPGDDAALLKMIRKAMQSSLLVQVVAKDYLYAGNGVAVTKSKREMAKAQKMFQENMKALSEVLTDPKSKNLMLFIQMNVDELKELLKQPYSMDNAQEVIDLAEAIAEGERKLASVFRKRLSKDYPVAKGQRYSVIQIAKYYMAYESGIKDAHTVKQMHDTVAKVDKFIQEYKAYPNNTVEMSQTVSEMEKLWNIVKHFYADIEEGGMPIIVYQTTNKLEKAMASYVNAVVKNVGK